MSESRGFSYAVVLAAAFTLWIPVAVFGAGGYSPLLALAAIPAFFYVRVRSGLNRLAGATLLLVIWAAISSVWSEESRQLMSGSLSGGNFSINAAGLRMILTAIAAILVIRACQRVEVRPVRAAVWIIAMIVLHGIVMLLMGLFPETTLDLYAPHSDRVREAPQNILRSANALFLAMPVLIGASWTLPRPYRYAAAGLTVGVGTLILFLLRSDVALLGMALVGLACLCVVLFRRNGFRILLGTVAVAIIASPIVLSAAAPVLVESELPLPASTKSRIFAWSLAAEKVRERPITGHGIESSKEWRETFADKPDLLKLMQQSTDLTDIPWDKYRILPGHPHNMGLQLWAETGLVGVALACVVLLLLALALPPPSALGLATSLAAAGLIGASFSLFSLSYSLWNEAFWAMVALVAAAIIIVDRLRTTP